MFTTFCTAKLPLYHLLYYTVRKDGSKGANEEPFVGALAAVFQYHPISTASPYSLSISQRLFPYHLFLLPLLTASSYHLSFPFFSTAFC